MHWRTSRRQHIFFLVIFFYNYYSELKIVCVKLFQERSKKGESVSVPLSVGQGQIIWASIISGSWSPLITENIITTYSMMMWNVSPKITDKVILMKIRSHWEIHAHRYKPLIIGEEAFEMTLMLEVKRSALRKMQCWDHQNDAISSASERKKNKSGHLLKGELKGRADLWFHRAGAHQVTTQVDF